MRKKYNISKWEYEILKNEGKGIIGYGFKAIIYRNGYKLHEQSAFGSESMAENYIKKYIIEHEFNIDLSENFEIYYT